MQRAVSGATIVWLGLVACGGDLGGGDPGLPDASTEPGLAGGGDGVDDEPPPSPWTALAEPMIALQGGSATSPAGQGHDGGRARVISDGAVVLDPAASLAAWPPAPPLPADGAVIGADELSADVTRAGTLRITGAVTTGGPDALRTITSIDGDLIIEGTLRSGDLGTTGQAIALRAPAGTVFVTGAVLTSPPGVLGDGDAAGAITISARQVVIDGRLVAAGEPDRAGEGGAGGAITIVATSGAVHAADAVLRTSGGAGGVRGGAGGTLAITAAGALLLSGTIDSSGGDVRGADPVVGGAGGHLQLSATGDLQLRSETYLRGGAATSEGATATGGDAGSLRLDRAAVASLAGLVDARGGPATTTGGGAALGGAAGDLLIGELGRPRQVQLRVPLHVDGGAGPARGGIGGALRIEPHGGDLVIASRIQLDGGASRLQPGRGGILSGDIGSASGGIQISGAILGRGGSATDPAVDAIGGDAAELYLQIRTRTGGFVLTATGQVILDGGASSGRGRAGRGGFIDLLGVDGDFTLAGRLQARGGDAPDPDGSGGDGGPLYVHTDTNYDGIGGNLTIQPTGVIDVSGGAGTIGGSATSNFEAGVEYFPQGRHQIAVLLNTDTAPGALQDGQINNLGTIIARGVANDGWGGDVVFHGRRPGHYSDPEPGTILLDGNGAGRDGEWFMQ